MQDVKLFGKWAYSDVDFDELDRALVDYISVHEKQQVMVSGPPAEKPAANVQAKAQEALRNAEPKLKEIVTEDNKVEEDPISLKSCVVIAAVFNFLWSKQIRSNRTHP